MSAPTDRGLLAPTPQGIWSLAQGVELLGEFEGAAYSERPWLLRRRDGQVIQISRLLYAIASYLDGKAASEDIAAAVSDRTGRSLSADNVEYLISHKLVPLGVIGDVPQETALPRSRALLALRFRVRVLPEWAHRRLSLLLRPLFAPAVILSLLAGLIGTDLIIAFTQRVGPSAATRDIANHPSLLLLITALMIGSAAVHEMGHATAVRYGGGNPGVMGVGIYLVWPVFYTDVSDAYRLDRKARLRTDLGGVYFNAIILTACSCIYLSTHYLPLLIFVVVGHIQILWQFLPFVRMDGYWILSDLVGVPNLFAFMGPILVSFGRTKDPRMVARLIRIKPWARRVITVWVTFTFAILALNAAFIIWTGPRILSTDLVASRGRALSIGSDFIGGNLVGGLNDITSLVLLTIPAAGIILIAALLCLRTARAVRRWWPKHRIRAASLGAVGMASLAVFAFEFVPKEITRPLEGGIGGTYWNYRNAPTTGTTQSASSSSLPVTRPLRDRYRATSERSGGSPGATGAPGIRTVVAVNPEMPASATPTTERSTPTERITPTTPDGAVSAWPSTRQANPSSPPVQSSSVATPISASSPVIPTTPVTAPQVTVPQVAVTTPTLATPVVTLAMPAVTTPPVTVSPVSVPPVTAPSVTVAILPANVPTVSAPPVTVPPVTVPPVTVPSATVESPLATVKTPEITTPPVSLAPLASTVETTPVNSPAVAPATVPPVSVPSATVETPVATVKTPAVTTPPVSVPSVTSSQGTIPQVTTPPVTAPAVTTPVVSVPSGTTPPARLGS
jgi:putative peptide zinc metalloprotease protein